MRAVINAIGRAVGVMLDTIGNMFIAVGWLFLDIGKLILYLAIIGVLFHGAFGYLLAETAFQQIVGLLEVLLAVVLFLGVLIVAHLKSIAETLEAGKESDGSD